MFLSVIIPAINEEECIAAAVNNARRARNVEVLVADGGSKDATVPVAREAGAKVLVTRTGRAFQMNEGAEAASGDALLFLHADTRLPSGYEAHVRRILDRPGVAAGAFRLGIRASGVSLRLVELVANLRSRCLQLPYGDQAIFVGRRRFQIVGGFPELPIMEDFALMKRLSKLGRVALAPVAVSTSGRRWVRMGVWRTTWINQMMVAAYVLGVPPERIQHWYRRDRGI
ncbi:MAG: TIGR04283 family arsenosugar biosynthesis glycosyltransferase [Deltaproteobacteria bacterium]|nr:TIGR04283 family arsenosugar biosynthesis glycosyltransferase [Deltaproteobacteria bacterium]